MRYVVVYATTVSRHKTAAAARAAAAKVQLKNDDFVVMVDMETVDGEQDGGGVSVQPAARASRKKEPAKLADGPPKRGRRKG